MIFFHYYGSKLKIRNGLISIFGCFSVIVITRMVCSVEYYTNTETSTTVEKIVEYAKDNDIHNHKRNYYTQSNTIYGHVHMAKTAGTNLNGKLAQQFERVCGNKGYSFNAYQVNKRFIEQNLTSIHDYREKYCYENTHIHNKRTTSSNSNGNNNNIINTLENNNALHNNDNDMDLKSKMNYGFEDCDYISMEIKNANFWKTDIFTEHNTYFNSLGKHNNLTIEFHVPCRDPIDHLLSQCNHLHKKYNCDNHLTANTVSNTNTTATIDIETIKNNIHKCLIEMDRFNGDVFNNISRYYKSNMKCFNYLHSTNTYIDYMSNILQPRRGIYLESTHEKENNDDDPYLKYKMRITNKSRKNIQYECLLDEKNLHIKEYVTTYLIETVPYYKFCNQCIGSTNDLLN